MVSARLEYALQASRDLTGHQIDDLWVHIQWVASEQLQKLLTKIFTLIPPVGLPYVSTN